jgi:lipopolysaccharide export LptBFGC system permease protein LptF
MEHAAQHGEGMAGQLAVITAILATLGAMTSYEGGATQAEATLEKNSAAIFQTQASDQWNYYQSKNTKQAIAEFAVDVVPEARRDAYRQDIKKFEDDKAKIRKEAERLEAQAKEADGRSEAQLHLHHRWAQATTVLQIAIALAAIALLTKRRWLEWGTLGVAALGVVIGAIAFVGS